jgi:hypothetical protein
LSTVGVVSTVSIENMACSGREKPLHPTLELSELSRHSQRIVGIISTLLDAQYCCLPSGAANSPL